MDYRTHGVDLTAPGPIGGTTPAAITGTTITATTGFVAPTGTNTAPTYSFAAAATVGLYNAGSGYVGLTGGNGAQVFAGTTGVAWFSTGNLQLPSTSSFAFSSGVLTSTSDVILARDAAATLALKNGATDQLLRKYGGNLGYEEWGSISENLTLSTGGTTTDTAANLLPANSFIEAVVGRVTTTIATATNWKLGDPTTAGRFTAANATLTAGTIDVGLVHIDVVGAGSPRQTSAAKVRVTTTGTPSAGAVRITSYYRTYVGATS